MRPKSLPVSSCCFPGHRGGGVAVAFALAIVPLLIAVAASVEFARVTALRATLQNVTDAAALDVATYVAQQSKAGATPTQLTVADKWRA